MPETLDCVECGTALNDRELLLGWDLCDWCKSQETKRLQDTAVEGWVAEAETKARDYEAEEASRQAWERNNGPVPEPIVRWTDD